MKELSIEQKAKAYDKALERAKIFKEHLLEINDKDYADEMNYIFPELRESDDERIRKAILNYLTKMWGNCQDDVCGVNVEDAIVWLEKQGEQMPGDKIESRFHVNEWVVTCPNDVVQIKAVNNGYYTIDNGMEFNMPYVDKYWHKWTIQDAKDGDVLIASDGSIFLFAGIVDCACKYYVALTTDNYVKINKEAKGGYWETSRAVYPATKEQCDLLFTKMKDAGYMWDADKKELKKIKQILVNSTKTCKDEQKSADKTKPKFHEGQWIVWQDKCYKVNYNGCGYELVDQNGLSTSLEYGTVDENAHLWDVAKDAKNGDVLVGEDNNIGIYKEIEGICWHSYIYLGCDNFLYGFRVGGSHIQNNTKPATKEQREQLKKAISDAGYTFDFDKKELKKIEKKFNVGDEIKTANEGPLAITKIDEKGYWSEDLFICDFDDAAKWELVEQKPAWSEEDKNFMYDTLSNLTELKDRYGEGYGNVGKCIGWLKTLKERCTWKPSDEQLDALQYVYRNSNPLPSDKLGWNSLKTLELMYHDLKKLKE